MDTLLLVRLKSAAKLNLKMYAHIYLIFFSSLHGAHSASASTLPLLSDGPCSSCKESEHTSREHAWHWSLPIRMVRVKFHKRLCASKVIQRRILLRIVFNSFFRWMIFYIMLIWPLFPPPYSIPANVIFLPIRKNPFW